MSITNGQRIQNWGFHAGQADAQAAERGRTVNPFSRGGRIPAMLSLRWADGYRDGFEAETSRLGVDVPVDDEGETPAFVNTSSRAVFVVDVANRPFYVRQLTSGEIEGAFHDGTSDEVAMTLPYELRSTYANRDGSLATILRVASIEAFAFDIDGCPMCDETVEPMCDHHRYVASLTFGMDES